MQIELENKLAEIETQIIEIENDNIKNEVVRCFGEDGKEGYLHALFEMKEWFEGMIANCE